MKFPTIEEMAQNIAENALDEWEYNGKTLRQWIEIILATDINVATKDGTDCISRQAAIEVVDAVWSVTGDKNVAKVWDQIKDLPSARPEQRWIPVSERLPEPRVDVWVNSDIGQIQGYYEEHVGVWYASFGQGRDYLELIVNAWMPLPEPYREERTEE